MMHMQSVSDGEVAIAMPLGRLSQWFNEALQSALNQTVSTNIYLIANGLSEEENNALRVISDQNPRVILHSFSERVGMIANWNRALNLVREPFLTMLHDDDLLEPWLIETLLEVKINCSGHGIYMTKERLIDAKGEFQNIEHLKRNGCFALLDRHGIEAWAVSNKVCATGFMLDRVRAISLGGYKESLSYTADWDLYFSLALEFSAVVVDVHGARYRFGGGTGQASSAFLRSGSFISEYRRQQLTNLSKIGVDPVDFEKISFLALDSFSRVVIRQFGESIDKEGIAALKELKINVTIARICGRLKNLLRHPVSKVFLGKLVTRNAFFRRNDIG
jgi:hypothetical protein